MKKALLLLLLPILALSLKSCDRDYYQARAERKAVGQYKFQKVVRHHGFLDAENITDEYDNMILQLNDKFEAALIDQNNNVTYTGDYDVIVSNTYDYDDDGSSDQQYTIIIDLRSSGRGNSGYYFVGEMLI